MAMHFGSPSLYGSGYRPLTTTNVYKTLSTGARAVIRMPRDRLAKVIASQFFYVLTNSGKQAELKEEQELHTRFWKTDKPTPPYKKEEILDCFHLPREEPFKVKLDGKTVTYNVSIVESKVSNVTAPPTGLIYNLVFIAGNHTRNDTMLNGTYAYLESYLTKRHEQTHFSGARIVTITGYDIRDEKGDMYFPETLEEHGRILKDALCAFQDKYGSIEHIIGHSLGGILLAAAMRQFRLAGIEKYLPKNYVLDRTPDSLYGASKNVYIYGCVPLGYIGYPFAWLVGWSLNVADEVNKFCIKYMTDISTRSCIVVDAMEDHRFKGALLGMNKKITDLAREANLIKILRVKLTGTQLNEGAHHGIQANAIWGWNVKQGNKELIRDYENLADAVLNISLCKKVAAVFEGKREQAA